MSKRPKQLYEFGPFRLDVTERLLLRDGQPVPITPKAFATLFTLVENSGHVVEKDVLMEKVWPDVVVEESTLAQNVFTLRKALGEGSARQYIETVPKLGYRFTAAVKELNEAAGDAIVEPNAPLAIVTEEELQTNGKTEEEQGRAQITRGSATRLSLGRGRTWIFVLVLLAGVAAVLFYFLRSKPKEADPEVKVIAVLPFKPISTQGRDEYLELGMADALITKLSGLGQLVVRSTSAVRKYTSLEQDPVVAGRELKVEAVLEGSVERIEDRLRVTARLVRVQDGASLWVYKGEQQSTDIFAVQDAISEQISRALALKLSGDDARRLTKRYTDDPDAYQLYLKGRYFWNKRTEDGLKRSVEYFRQATQKDPTYALAYAGLADSYRVLAYLGYISPQETVAESKQAALKALELDDTIAEAHTALADSKFNDERDFAGAEREYRRAIELNPNFATAHQRYSLFLITIGRSEESLAEISRAQEADPVSLIISTSVGWTHYFSHQYDTAIEQYQRTLEMDPNFGYTHWRLGQAYEQKGMYVEAIAEFRYASKSDTNPGIIASLGHAYAKLGRRREAEKILDELQYQMKRDYVPPRYLALIYTALGATDQAFEWLAIAFKDHDPGLASSLNCEPQLDSLRSDPRFQELLRSTGLATK